MIRLKIFSIIVCLGRISGSPLQILHDHMTYEERNFYFGDKSIDNNFELGTLKKISQENTLLRRVVAPEQLLEDEYHFQAFNTNMRLKLKPNDILVSTRASIGYLDENGKETRKKFNPEHIKCLGMHKDEKAVAAIYACGDGKYEGFITTREDTYEVIPLTERLKNLLLIFRTSVEDAVIINDTYIIKRATFPNFTKTDHADIENWDIEDEVSDDTVLDIELFEIDQPSPDSPKLIEMALFLDHIAYRRFSSVYSDEEIEKMLLAYINQVHSIFHTPNLGQQVDLMVVYLEIQRAEQFENYDGERTAILNSFCEYSNANNPDDDKANPRHWDIGIHLSGLDIWAEENGYKEYGTLGLSRTGSMCDAKFSCVTVELGVWSALGSSYPTTGFSAAYVLAHELGHTLGMRHDRADGCEDSSYIMAERNNNNNSGQTSWSSCSAKSLKKREELRKLECLMDRPSKGPKWEQNNTMGVPGHFITAEEQCKFYFNGKEEATVASSPADDSFCNSMKCRNGKNVKETGPPLEGTSCGDDGARWCREGKCESIIGARWSVTKKSNCRSACLARSSGYSEIDRVCLTLEGFENQECEGPEKWVELCDDSHLCGTRSCASQRITRTQAATVICEKQSRYLPGGLGQIIGKPARHSPDRPWQACTVYCRKGESGKWMSPRGAQFPDGTWCHNDGAQDFFCRNHVCLPANYSFF